MSKKLNTSGTSSTPKNTLLNYFAASPASQSKKKLEKTPRGNEEDVREKENLKVNEKEDVVKTPKSKAPQSDSKKKKPSNSVDRKSSKGDDLNKSGGKKRRRILIEDSEPSDDEEKELLQKFESDGDDDYKPSSESEDEDEDVDEDISMENEKEKEESNSDSDNDTPVKVKTKRSQKSSFEPQNKKRKVEVNDESFLEKLKSFQEGATNETNNNEGNTKGDKGKYVDINVAINDEPVVWPHQKLEFLKPDKIKDKDGHRPDHPDYDPTTLYVPEKFLNSLSPGVRQWWILKSNNYDCVLFFKVGKFYELYHMDADIGVSELGFTYMRGEFAHSGFPEISFDKMSTILIDRGYKIARVEQTETPDMMEARLKTQKTRTKFDKVVRREICQISNRGTQVFGSQCQITPNYQHNYLLSIVEKVENSISRYGVCFVDTSIGDFYMGEFSDDKNCSRLLTLLSHHYPVLVLYERSSLSEATQQILRTMLSNILKEQMSPTEAQNCNAEKVLSYLAEKYYCTGEEKSNWPDVLHMMRSESDHLGLTPKSDFCLTLKALGQCITYIRKCHLEEKVMPMAHFQLYIPPDVTNLELDKLPENVVKNTHRSHMVLDAATLSNLRILDEQFSLLSTLDNCCTKFGKRLLQHWLCTPSCRLDVITERQQAIGELLQNEETLEKMRSMLSTVPDLERYLAQIHMFGNKIVKEKHPDGRAILFEEKLYNKKKIQKFVSILNSFKSITAISSIFQNFESPLLQRLTQLRKENGMGAFPDMEEILNFFDNAFNHKQSCESGVIAPEAGVDSDYDAVQEKIESINETLKDYLAEQEKIFGCRLSYFGTDRKRFQIEVPESRANKAGSSYQLESQRKGSKAVKRFSTNETREFLKQMQNAEEQRTNVLNDLSRRVFEKFSKHYEIWKQAIDCVANIDVLCSLTEYARKQSTVCVPVFKKDAPQPFIKIEEGFHPCVTLETYIPNGILLGADNIAPLSILTGPNMGGKSTLMRQIGLLVVMAQIGAHIPATSFEATIVDRIFTRLGAQDDILAGHSTFLVELNETSLILKHATEHSLVLLDELGRGTATYDGTAIAASVVDFLANLKCRTLFSTHYHNLIDFFEKDPRITLGHMACMVENDDSDDPTEETVTFLYKYTAGACPKSYGFNAAKLAGMPKGVIKRAYKLSKQVEAITLKHKITNNILCSVFNGAEESKDAMVDNIKNLMQQLVKCHV